MSEDYCGMGRPRISYDVDELNEAGLVREERRGRWSFYSLDRAAAGRLLVGTSDHLGVTTRDN